MVTNLAIKHSVGVLMLAECNISPGNLLFALNQQSQIKYHLPDNELHKLVIYTRFPRRFSETWSSHLRFTIRRLTLPQAPELILVVTHSPSKRNFTSQSQDSECEELASEIRRAEGDIGHSRTILVGDLNMNPFQYGVYSSRGLHGVMSRNLALRQARTVQTKRYPFFYNPMWSLLGDATTGPPGTYYFERSEHDNLYWNMYDQVMLRPDLLPYFRNEDLKILTTDGSVSFLSSKGRPDESVASDHLPILFKLNF
jgi:hypothetical protein